MKLAEKLAITIGFLLIPGGIEINSLKSSQYKKRNLDPIP